jgi:hypothetical protein
VMTDDQIWPNLENMEDNPFSYLNFLGDIPSVFYTRCNLAFSQRKITSNLFIK